MSFIATFSRTQRNVSRCKLEADNFYFCNSWKISFVTHLLRALRFGLIACYERLRKVVRPDILREGFEKVKKEG